jgi:hypothetical protein
MNGLTQLRVLDRLRDKTRIAHLRLENLRNTLNEECDYSQPFVITRGNLQAVRTALNTIEPVAAETLLSEEQQRELKHLARVALLEVHFANEVLADFSPTATFAKFKETQS